MQACDQDEIYEPDKVLLHIMLRVLSSRYFGYLTNESLGLDHFTNFPEDPGSTGNQRQPKS